MARLNKAVKFTVTTHEGAPAARINSEQALRRSVLSCLLWEDEHYESGEEIAKRIQTLANEVTIGCLANLAIEARTDMHLRHVPLLLLSILAKRKGLTPGHVWKVVQRADELTELLAIHAKLNGVGPDKLKGKIPSQMKRGLALAFGKFDEYQLAKYDRAGAIRLRDVMFLCHPKPADEVQASLWKRLAENELVTPDTWEVGLSTGGDKKEVFTRLLTEKKLGYFALLRNLRNMMNAGVDRDLVEDALIARKGGAEKILPFRYVAAARACPQLVQAIDKALCASIDESIEFPGLTVVLVDTSGSMRVPLSSKSDLQRQDAAAALASVFKGKKRVFSFADSIAEAPAYNGLAGVEAINRTNAGGGTDIGRAVRYINENVPCDRLIVITDEQSNSLVPTPKSKKAYMINVASNKNGIGYGNGWTHIDGWSEGIFKYIMATEGNEQ